MGAEVIPVPVSGRSRPAVVESFAVPGWIAQQNSWIESPKNSDSAAYNYPLLLRISGTLNDNVLRSSLDELVQRHATLRSVFELRDDVLTQVVLGEHACPFKPIDLRAIAESEREQAAHAIVTEHSETAFRLSEEIPCRAVLLRLGDELHELLVVTHHLAYDDWSNGVLIQELSTLYAAFAAGEASPLPGLPVQYGDFVRGSARKMAGRELAENIAFWKGQLGDGATFHHLRADATEPNSPRTPGPLMLVSKLASTSERVLQEPTCLKPGGREKIVLPEALSRALNRWTREQHASLFMTLMTGFQCLLHLYSGDEDVAVGTCVANRPQMQLEKLIGRFGNHLIIRTSMAGNPFFHEAEQRVREACLTAYGYEEMPFGEALRAARPDRGARCDKVVQAMFVFQNAPKGSWQIPGLDVRSMPVKRRTTRYDLTLWLRNADALEILLDYNAALFRAGTIQEFLNDYREILEYMAAHPTTRIFDCPVGRRKMQTLHSARRLAR